MIYGIFMTIGLMDKKINKNGRMVRFCFKMERKLSW